MNPLSLERLQRLHPRLFANLTAFECGSGWFHLIDGLAQQLGGYTKEGAPELRAQQVKEKFGQLRFYVSTRPSERQRGAIDLAEALSVRICEECGCPGQLQRVGYRMMTRCPAHQLREGDVREVLPDL